MAFPGAIPSYAGFTGSHSLSADNHAAQSNAEQADIIALATKVGTGASTPASGLVLRSSGAGVSAWGQVTLTSDVSGVLPVANGGLGQASLTGLTLPAAILSSSPTIADFTNATHTHASNAQGGQLNGANALGAASVPDSKLIYGKVRTRQGGSATNWQTVGTTTYDYSATNTFMQCGAAAMNASPTTINFPTAFSQVPVVVAVSNSVVSASVFVRILNVTTTSFQIQAVNAADVNTTTENCNWIAVGE